MVQHGKSAPAKLDSLDRNSGKPGRSTTNTPLGFSWLPLPTRWVVTPWVRRGALRGVKLLIRVPSKSNTTVSLPCNRYYV